MNFSPNTPPKHTKVKLKVIWASKRLSEVKKLIFDGVFCAGKPLDSLIVLPQTKIGYQHN